MVQCPVLAEPGGCVGVAADLAAERRWGSEFAALLSATRGEPFSAANSVSSKSACATQVELHT